MSFDSKFLGTTSSSHLTLSRLTFGGILCCCVGDTLLATQAARRVLEHAAVVRDGRKDNLFTLLAGIGQVLEQARIRGQHVVDEDVPFAQDDLRREGRDGLFGMNLGSEAVEGAEALLRPRLLQLLHHIQDDVGAALQRVGHKIAGVRGEDHRVGELERHWVLLEGRLEHQDVAAEDVTGMLQAQAILGHCSADNFRVAPRGFPREEERIWVALNGPEAHVKVVSQSTRRIAQRQAIALHRGQHDILVVAKLLRSVAQGSACVGNSDENHVLAALKLRPNMAQRKAAVGHSIFGERQFFLLDTRVLGTRRRLGRIGHAAPTTARKLKFGRKTKERPVRAWCRAKKGRCRGGRLSRSVTEGNTGQ
eukprot:scaffold1509_cov240-Pinguiococcus_pyrenoidosus.AAC.19